MTLRGCIKAILQYYANTTGDRAVTIRIEWIETTVLGEITGQHDITKIKIDWA